jgi:hypothetical protein
VLAITGLAVAVAGVRAHAQPAGSRGSPRESPAASKIAIADQLFAEGKALFDSNLLQACGKFDESLRYNPAAIGTLLNVALCDEKLGRVASAVAKFSEARDRAAEQGLREHVRAAEEHIAKLQPSVPHLTIVLSERVPDTTILLDDHVVQPGALDNLPVDPGERIIVVSAPARLPYRRKLLIGRAEHQRVEIPVLANSVIVTSSRRFLGQVFTGGGGVVTVVGVGLGLYANHLYQQQFGHQESGDGKCNDMNVCEAEGQANTRRARTLGNFGTAVGVAGIVIAGVGAYLWLSSPRESAGDQGERQITLVPQLGTDGLGIAAAGRF